MKSMKILMAIVAITLILTGCNLVEVNPKRDAQIVVAKVADEIVTKGDFNDLFYMYQLYGYITQEIATDPAYVDTLNMYKQSILDTLVDEKILGIKAVQLGCYDFTSQEKEQLDESLKNNLETYKSMLRSDIVVDDDNKDLSEDDITTLVEDGFDEYLVELGVDIDAIIKSNEDSIAQDKLYEKITDITSPTEEVINARFEYNLAFQKAGIQDGTILYENIANDGTSAVYTVPNNVRLVQHILIPLQDDATNNISTIRQTDADLADETLATALEIIQADADAAYQRAISGEDFVLLMDELSSDGLKGDNYYTVMNPTAYFMPTFAQGLFELNEVGDISKPVATDFGYHIIKYYGDMPSGDVSIADVHDIVKEEIFQESKSAVFQENLATWREELKVKTYIKKLD